MTDVPQIAEHKADFSTIYDQPDPRPFYRTLQPLDYRVPQEARPTFDAVIAASARDGRPRDVVDLCCSYGINAALLKWQLDLADLSAHYTGDAAAELTSAQLVAADRALLASRPRRHEVIVRGLDAAPEAIDYAVRAGILDDGWAEDLEGHDPSPGLAAGLASTGLVVCTGGVGYIGAPTFRRLLDVVDRPRELWLAVFVLRQFPYDDVAAVLAEYDLVTEHLPEAAVRQRRFTGADERDAALADVRARGLDPGGKEAEGWYWADLYLSRPSDEVARTPAASVLPAMR